MCYTCLFKKRYYVQYHMTRNLHSTAWIIFSNFQSGTKKTKRVLKHTTWLYVNSFIRQLRETQAWTSSQFAYIYLCILMTLPSKYRMLMLSMAKSDYWSKWLNLVENTSGMILTLLSVNWILNQSMNNMQDIRAVFKKTNLAPWLKI
jgi:hypothetical protein